MSTQPRVPVTVRLDKHGDGASVDEIDALAEEEERDRSSMIRKLLREAITARRISKAAPERRNRA